MDPHSINAFFFPTKVLFVDDDLNYTSHIAALLNQQKASFKISDKPLIVSEYLLNSYNPTEFLKNAISRPESGVNQTRLDIDIQEIYKIVYNPARFSEITVLVTDFHMPEQTGQQLCEELIGLPIKKLMITSEADEKLAVSLLNKLVINKFIKKALTKNSHNTFIKDLEEMIEDLQESYFNQQSYDVLKHIEFSDEHIPACIRNEDFIEIFKKIITENNICEYYLIDTTGSFLLLTPSGDQSYLLVQSLDDMRTAIELAECSNEPNQEVLNSLRTGEKILYWDTTNEFPNSSADQLNHSYSSKKMGKYYYSYVNDNVLGLNQSKITSFKQFLEKDFSNPF